MTNSNAADPAPDPPMLVLVGPALVRQDDKEAAIARCVDK